MLTENSDDLLREIEDSPALDSLRIWGLSGAGFVLRFEDEVVYVDPWLVTPNPPRTTHRVFPIPFPPERIRKASSVISTHEHSDHCDVATIAGILKSTGAVFLGPKSATDKVVKGGVPSSRTATLTPGMRFEISSTIQLRVFP